MKTALFASLLLLASCARAPSSPAVAAPAPPSAVPASPSPSAEPSVDDVLHDAAKTGSPVLLEFSTVWCKPCAELAKTLDEPTVRAALQGHGCG